MPLIMFRFVNNTRSSGRTKLLCFAVSDWSISVNNVERQMLDILKRGRDHYGVVAVKAEFEAEGTRPDEFHRLLEITQRADLKVALKIGGCEAVSDLFSSKIYGTDYIIAPMVETPYSLQKFIEAKQKTYGDGNGRTEFLFNLETKTTLANLEEMANIATEGGIGIVFGRVDFTLSCGKPRGAINDRDVTDSVLKVARVCAASDLDLVVGGSVSPDSIDALREFRSVRLDRFETRKVVFDGSAVEKDSIVAGIENAVEFELAWLRNKRDYYHAIAIEDAPRIAMMEKRLSQSQPSPNRVAA